MQDPDVLADRVGRLVVMDLPLDLMGAEAEAVGHDAEDDQDGEEIPLAVPDPAAARVPMRSDAISRPPWVRKSATVRKSVCMR